MASIPTFDVAVIGGGPAGATAAHDLACKGHSVLLLDKAGRIKPCGGAIPPRLLRDFGIPESLLVAEIKGAGIISPSARRIEMPIEVGGFVGMVDRGPFDAWLRERAAKAGATLIDGSYMCLERDGAPGAVVVYRDRAKQEHRARARVVIGADGANSQVAREIPGRGPKLVFAYHEIIRAPAALTKARYEPERCDVYYDGRISPDFYGWVFPHGETASVGVGSAHKGFGLREATAQLRAMSGLADCETIRREGAPIPLSPRRTWDNGRDIVLAGDAAGVVAPASGEGIYYAMYGGRVAADAVARFLATGRVAELATARRTFMRAHGRVFAVLRVMQWFWYSSDSRRERFVTMCGDPDVQKLTWEAYMNKKLVKARPMAHARIFAKDMAHLLGLVSP